MVGAGNADVEFADTGLGYLAGATISTGNSANDDTLIISFSGSDTVFSHLRSGLRLVAGAIDTVGGNAFPADTILVTTMNVINVRNDSAYQTILEALYATTVAWDTLRIFDNGYYTDPISININGLVWTNAGDNTPVIKPNGNTR